MAGFTLTTDATVLCPHGGQVQFIASNSRITAGGAIVVASDTATIVGCPFTLPSTTPSPCVRVSWTVADTRVTAAGTATLSAGSVGLCLAATGAPQGTAVIVSTQTRAQSV